MIIETEDDLKKILSLSFPEFDDAITMILFHEKTVHIFAEKHFIKKQSKDIKKYIISLESNIKNITFHYPNTINLTKSALLRVIKEFSPINSNELKKILKNKNIEFEEKDLKNKVNKLRKTKHVFRLKDRSLTLTLKGVESVPISKSRSSSDIVRALVLGKKKW